MLQTYVNKYCLINNDPYEYQLNKANVSETEASFFYLHLSISDGFVKTKIFDKRDYIDFDIVTFYQNFFY